MLLQWFLRERGICVWLMSSRPASSFRRRVSSFQFLFLRLFQVEFCSQLSPTVFLQIPERRERQQEKGFSHPPAKERRISGGKRWVVTRLEKKRKVKRAKKKSQSPTPARVAKKDERTQEVMTVWVKKKVDLNFKMRESRWRSMSIMDLNLTRRKSNSSSASTDGGGGGAGLGLTAATGATHVSASQQSYELIKSTQVRFENLNA